MAGAVDPNALSRMLSETLAAFQDFHARSGDSADSDPPVGEGTAAGGMITVRAVLPGEISAIELNPRVMRMPSEQLAEELTSAVNQALANLRELSVTAGGGVNLDALGDRLREIQEDTSRQLAAFTNSLVEAQAMIVRRAGNER